MRIVQKTVFISYRRANAPWAIAISQYLTHKGFDVFIDFKSIKSGDFAQIITESIHARAHFLVLLTPSAIEKCNEPNDWLRKEIEIAVDSQRNIIPVLLEGFEFDAPETKKFLTGKLEYLQKYNALKLYADYFFEGMDRLCNQFLDIALKDVHHPLIQKVSKKTKQAVEEIQHEIKEQPPVEEKILSAQEWLAKALKTLTKPEEKIRLLSKAIELDPKFERAYFYRGGSYADLGHYEKAIDDYTQAIRLNPKYYFAYNNRGIAYHKLNQYIKAIEDFSQAIQLNPNLPLSYNWRGSSYANLGQYEKAIKEYNHAIQLDPELAFAHNYRGLSYMYLNQYKKAIADFDKAIELNPDYIGPLYSKASLNALQGNIEITCNFLCQVFKLDLEKYCELIRTDPDFDSIREDERFKELIAEYCGDC